MEQIGIDCLRLIKRKMAGEMTTDEYYIALMELHKKYPLKCGPNFYDVAQMYAKRIPMTLTISSNPSRVNERLPYKDD
jgi:hypothetical protein